MKRMGINLILTAFIIGIFAGKVVGREVKEWEVFEIEMTARNKYSNPYLEGLSDQGEALVHVKFTGTSGKAQGMSFTITGFWDGGKTWKVRFAPPVSGIWSYISESKDRGLNGIKGTFSCTELTEGEKKENPTKHGFVLVCKTGRRAGRYFEYSDGTPFLWIGDTWWNWTYRGIYLSTFQKLVDDRAEKGFTVGQLFVPGNGWSQRSSILDSTYTIVDIQHMRKIDSMITYANSRGMTMWVHAWWSRENIDKKIGAQKMRRWWRYLIHRFGAYNVTWVMAGEYNMNNYGGLGLQFWKDLGKMIKDEDPYKRIVSVHPTPPNWRGGKDAPQWSTGDVLHNEPWLDYNQSQIGHERFRNEMVPIVAARDYARTPVKPHVQSECWYELLMNPTAEDIRFAGWSNLLSGGAGHTYGSRPGMTAFVKETYIPREGREVKEEDFMLNALDVPGAVSIGHMSKFFKRIKWWELEPHPELVSDYAQNYCAAIPGHEYVTYLRWGGAVTLDLNPSTSSDTFQFTWFDPRTGKDQKDSTATGGGKQFFRAPNDDDWILYVKKKE